MRSLTLYTNNGHFREKRYFSFSVEGGEKLKEIEDEDEGEPEREFVAADEFDESDIDDIEDMHEGRGSAKFRTLFSPLSGLFFFL